MCVLPSIFLMNRGICSEFRYRYDLNSKTKLLVL